MVTALERPRPALHIAAQGRLNTLRRRVAAAWVEVEHYERAVLLHNLHLGRWRAAPLPRRCDKQLRAESRTPSEAEGSVHRAGVGRIGAGDSHERPCAIELQIGLRQEELARR